MKGDKAVILIKPAKVRAKARKLRKQNYEFRIFLKRYADPDELDAQFSALHTELFADCDCLSCNNCCKAFDIVLGDDEIIRISAYLRLRKSDFIEDYLIIADNEDACDEKPYKFEEDICPFLCDNGRCKIQDCKPDVCRDFPFTDQPGRLSCMYNIIEHAEVCPVVFEILERLKEIYCFGAGNKHRKAYTPQADFERELRKYL